MRKLWDCVGGKYLYAWLDIINDQLQLILKPQFGLSIVNKCILVSIEFGLSRQLNIDISSLKCLKMVIWVKSRCGMIAIKLSGVRNGSGTLTWYRVHNHKRSSTFLSGFQSTLTQAFVEQAFHSCESDFLVLISTGEKCKAKNTTATFLVSCTLLR